MNIPFSAMGAAPFEYAFVRQLKIENLYAHAAGDSIRSATTTYK